MRTAKSSADTDTAGEGLAISVTRSVTKPPGSCDHLLCYFVTKYFSVQKYLSVSIPCLLQVSGPARCYREANIPASVCDLYIHQNCAQAAAPHTAKIVHRSGNMG